MRSFYEGVVGEGAGVVAGADLGGIAPLDLRVNQTIRVAAMPATSPAIPRGIQGIADSRSMNVDVRDGDLGRLRLVEERRRAMSIVRAMSRVTVTGTGPVTVPMVVWATLCIVRLAALSLRSSRPVLLS